MAAMAAMAAEGPLPAGGFSGWATQMRGALQGGRDAEVPCGSCSACCTASQFVHIGPDEVDALAHIPAELLFPAPRAPEGHVLLGYDERGHCPMLVDGKCSIYAHRPRTCRTYDCRVFAAAGVAPAGAQQVAIGRRVRRWRFSYDSSDDQLQHEAMRAAARYLGEHPDDVPAVTTPAGVAVMAFEIHDLFVVRDAATDSWSLCQPELEAVQSRLAALGTSGA
jgi:Fe-S-cluster containining protein